MSLRSLSSIALAAKRQGLQVIPTYMREVLFECPQCKASGLRALASATTDRGGTPSITCRGCETWGDDPHEILGILGHDPLVDDPYEVVLRIFDLLRALERADARDTIRDTQSGREPRNKSNALGSVTGCPSTSLPRHTSGVSTP